MMRTIIDRLTVETIRVPKVGVFAYLVGVVDFPRHPNVTVVVHPREGQSFEDPVMLKSAEERCRKHVRNFPRILKNASKPTRAVFLRYFPKRRDVPADELIKGLTLSHVKIIFDTGDELILGGNKYYPGLDLNLKIEGNGDVKEAWFDG